MQKSIIVTLGIILFIAGELMAKTSVYCIHNAPALAGSVVLGTFLAFIVSIILSKIIRTRNKAASFFINIFLIIVWLLCCYFVCYLIRLIFFK